MRPDGLRNPRPVVGDRQFYPIRRVTSAYGDPDAAVLALRIAQRVAAEVPHHLIQVTAVERDGRIHVDLEIHHLLADLFDLAELRDERAQERAHLKSLAMCAVAAIELEDVLH